MFDNPQPEDGAMKKKNLLTVLLSFLKVGTIGFGGGAALIPVIETELVENKKWITREKFDVSVAVSTISPASLPVSLCSIWDSRYSLISAYSYALPGPLIYLILLTGFTYIGEIGAMYLRFTSVGLIAFVLFLLCRFIRKNYLRGVEQGIKKQYLIIMIAAFLLTNGNNMRRLAWTLFALDLQTPLFSIDIIYLILLLLFFVGFTGSSKSVIKYSYAVLLAVFFALAAGRRGVLNEWMLPLVIVMLVSVTVSIVYDIVTNREKPVTNTQEKPYKFDYRPLRNLLLFIAVSIALVVLVFAVSGDSNVWTFAAAVVTSSLSSFGGGEVYIGISEAFFVHTGFIPEINYSTHILGIANSMPGPVLCAIVTGVGYTYGSVNYGVGFGWMFGVLGWALAVAATAFGALTLYICYEFVREKARLRMIIRYIMPVVCGMLMTTALSLLRQAMSVFTIIDQNVNPFLCTGIVLAITLLMFFLHKKFRVNDIALLLTGGVGTLGVMSAIIALQAN